MTKLLVLVGSDMEDTYYSYTTQRELVKGWIDSDELVPSDELVGAVAADSSLGTTPKTMVEVRTELDLTAAYQQALQDFSGNGGSSGLQELQALRRTTSSDEKLNVLAPLLPPAAWDAQEFASWTRAQAEAPEILEYVIY